MSTQRRLQPENTVRKKLLGNSSELGIGAETVGTSGHHSNFVVKALDGTGGNLAVSPEPVQQEFLVGAKHTGHFLHRLQAAAHGAFGPVVQKRSGPDDGLVVPEVEEGFLQLPGSGRGHLAGQQSIEFLPSSSADPAAATQ